MSEQSCERKSANSILHQNRDDDDDVRACMHAIHATQEIDEYCERNDGGLQKRNIVRVVNFFYFRRLCFFLIKLSMRA